MNKKLLICLYVCYFIVPIKSKQSAPANCKQEIGTGDYENFYVIECGNTNQNEIYITIYVDNPSDINILLTSCDRYESEDEDNYEIAIVGGEPMIVLGSEFEIMNENADASSFQSEGASADCSPEKITIQIRSGSLYLNMMDKTYSYNLPNVVNVKYLSFADFTGDENMFYFNCPEDCCDNAESEKKTPTWYQVKNLVEKLLQRLIDISQ